MSTKIYLLFGVFVAGEIHPGTQTWQWKIHKLWTNASQKLPFSSGILQLATLNCRRRSRLFFAVPFKRHEDWLAQEITLKSSTHPCNRWFSHHMPIIHPASKIFPRNLLQPRCSLQKKLRVSAQLLESTSPIIKDPQKPTLEQHIENPHLFPGIIRTGITCFLPNKPNVSM